MGNNSIYAVLHEGGKILKIFATSEDYEKYKGYLASKGKFIFDVGIIEIRPTAAWMEGFMIGHQESENKYLHQKLREKIARRLEN